MSDHSREQLFVATAAKKNLLLSSSSSSPPPLKAQSQLANYDKRDDHQATGKGSSSGKLLTSDSGNCPTTKYLGIELNNNSIVQEPQHQQPPSIEKATSGSLIIKKMDSSSVVNAIKQQQTRKLQSNNLSASSSNGGASSNTNHTPSYSSIFASPTYNRQSVSPPQEIQNLRQQQRATPRQQLSASSAARRGSNHQLRKQDNLEIPTLSLEKSLSHKKLSTFEFADSDDVKRADCEDVDSHENENEEEDDDEDEDEEEAESDYLGNERKPFKSASLAKLNYSSKGRKNLSNKNHHNHNHPNRCQSFNNSNNCARQLTSRCINEAELQQQQQQPYTKISFNESRPPSFSACQAASFNHHYHHNDGKLETGWQIPVCARCNCTKCTKKVLKIKNDLNGCSTIQMDPYAKTYTRTKSIHLILKSIILVLLTLLLLLMFIGIIMATHYLPSLFDKVLNVSRSFNVTIAGR